MPRNGGLMEGEVTTFVFLYLVWLAGKWAWRRTRARHERRRARGPTASYVIGRHDNGRTR